jgi:hypothetical protein
VRRDLVPTVGKRAGHPPVNVHLRDGRLAGHQPEIETRVAFAAEAETVAAIPLGTQRREVAQDDVQFGGRTSDRALQEPVRQRHAFGEDLFHGCTNTRVNHPVTADRLAGYSKPAGRQPRSRARPHVAAPGGDVSVARLRHIFVHRLVPSEEHRPVVRAPIVRTQVPIEVPPLQTGGRMKRGSSARAPSAACVTPLGQELADAVDSSDLVARPGTVRRPRLQHPGRDAGTSG